MVNPITTLTTDSGAADCSQAAMKVAIFSRVSDVTLVDVTRDAKPQEVAHASFVLGMELSAREPWTWRWRGRTEVPGRARVIWIPRLAPFRAHHTTACRIRG